MILKTPLGQWTGPPIQIWRNFDNQATIWVVHAMNDATPHFSEYTVHQQTQHQSELTPMDIASIYTSLEETNWNIMIPVGIHETRSCSFTISFHEQVMESTQPSKYEDSGFANYIKTHST
jgi:hypothetical protein